MEVRILGIGLGLGHSFGGRSSYLLFAEAVPVFLWTFFHPTPPVQLWQ